MSTTAPPLPPATPFSLRRTLRLARKELRETLRDRRTVLTLIGMPLVLYPLIGLIFFVFYRQPLAAMGRTTYRLGFVSENERIFMKEFLDIAERALNRDEGFEFPPDLPELERADPAPHIQVLPELHYVVLEDVNEAVQAGSVDVGLVLSRREGFTAPAPDMNRFVDWEVYYRVDSTHGREAVRYLSRLCEGGAVEELVRRNNQLAMHFLKRRLEARLPPVRLLPRVLPNPEGNRNTLLGALLPLILVLMTITGAVYPAIDLTAGERERGTLEILMAAPIPRLSLLLAKYFTVLTVALLTAVINLIAMTVTILSMGAWAVLVYSGARTLLVLVEVLGLLVLFAAFFSALLLTLTSVARSFKEAQAYLVPVMLLALLPGLLALLPGLKLEGAYVLVPLLNIVLLARDLLEGGARLLPAVLVVSVTLIYALAALALAARVFGRETIAGSEAGRWTELWQRMWPTY